MKEMQFTVEINATKEVVWDTLWQDETLRKWAGMIDAGTYMVGTLTEGATVQFNSASGFGVTSLVEKLIPDEYVLFKHRTDTRDQGRSERKDQWSGGKESYMLIENNKVTTLEMRLDVPSELEQVMSVSYPKALEKVKELAEGS